MSFLPIITLYYSGIVAEAAGKYFIAQVVGSCFFLFSAWAGITPLTEVMSTGAMLLAMIIKAGMAPMHQWFVDAVGSMRWIPARLLLTWQKLIPLRFLFAFVVPLDRSFAVIVGLLNGGVGGLGGLRQTQVRPLLAYSSISHMGWSVSISSVSFSAGVGYLMGYIFLVMPLVVLFAVRGVKSAKSVHIIRALSPTLL